MKAVGSSTWAGSFRDGTGTISTASDTLRDAPYTFASRFRGARGAAPEELLAAAHAGCFNHAFANILGLRHDREVQTIDTVVEVAMGTDDRGPAVTAVHITTHVEAPDATTETLVEVGEMAGASCALSKALSVPVTVRTVTAP